jgi:hypothetical protein
VIKLLSKKVKTFIKKVKLPVKLLKKLLLKTQTEPSNTNMI